MSADRHGRRPYGGGRRRRSRLQKLRDLPGELIARYRRQTAPHPSRLEHPSAYGHHRRRRRTGPIRMALRRFVLRPMLEILDMVEPLTAPLRLHPALLLPLGGVGLWLGWPWLAPALLPLLGATGGTGSRVPPPEVISVFVEDPTRSVWALNLWKNKPGSLLVMQGRPSSQIANVQYLRSQGHWPEDAKRLVTLEPGCDTVGQVAALARLLEQQRRPGRVTMVTSNAHLPRTLAIARTVLGPMGWQVDGLPVVTQDNRPEDPIRLWRDQLRAQMLRFTGISGSRSDELCE